MISIALASAAACAYCPDVVLARVTDAVPESLKATMKSVRVQRRRRERAQGVELPTPNRPRSRNQAASLLGLVQQMLDSVDACEEVGRHA
jgi:hypothetical protein